MRFGFFIMGTRSGTYQDILEQVQMAEELGFNGVWLGERHFEYSDLLYPSPFHVGAAIAAKTRQIRIGTAGRILPLDHPIHVAEDAATLDILSGGRLDLGVTRAGLDERFHQVFHSSMDETRGRFEEALEIIVKAWTCDRFAYEGRYYQVPEVSVFPKPIQNPHPPICVVAVSRETIAFAAQKGYPIFVGAIQTQRELKDTLGFYWRTFREAGHDGATVDLPVNRFLYVGESNTKAREEVKGMFQSFIQHKAPDLKAALHQKYGEKGFSVERFIEDFCIFGDPDLCITKINELRREVGLTYLLCTLNFVTMDHTLCLKSMERFAKEVIPYFKEAPQGLAPLGR
jgi:alkanesulfonate monooxygenase SsuD/methylene tetrahydromethanopterin reductase-like flavin-dependent oxidoreductase (luciferase family)